MQNKKKLTDSFISSVTTDKRIEIYDDTRGYGGLVLRVTPTGHKSFAYRYWYQGQSKQITIGTYGTYSLLEARKEFKDLKKLIDKGIDPIQKKHLEKKARPMTIGEAIDYYKEYHLPSLKKSTQDNYKIRLGMIESEFPRGRYIKDIKRFELIDYLDKVSKKTPTNAKRIQALLSGLFNFAKDREWVSDNIAAKIKVKKPTTKNEWENVVYTDEQIKILWETFSNHTEPVGSFFKFLLVTGQRAGETRLTKWADIDFSKKIWTIPSVNTKNGMEHYVFLSDKAIEILNKLKEWSTDFVFESMLKPGQPITHPQKSAERIKKQTGIDFNAHSLRTTFVTKQAELGTLPQVLSKLVNHKKAAAGSDITALYNKYDYDEEKRIAVQKWSREIDRIVTGEQAKIYPIKINA